MKLGDALIRLHAPYAYPVDEIGEACYVVLASASAKSDDIYLAKRRLDSDYRIMMKYKSLKLERS
jgi:hypothetical protein